MKETWSVMLDHQESTVDFQTLKEWIECGRLGPDNRVRRGAHGWTAIRLVPQLRSIQPDPEKVRAEGIRKLKSDIPSVPVGTMRCRDCAAENVVGAARCGSCGGNPTPESWINFLGRYKGGSDADRAMYWELLGETGRRFLERAITAENVGAREAQSRKQQITNIPQGALSCPRCGCTAFGSRSGCIILLIILTFPFGLILLLIKPTYRCVKCGYTFKA